MQPEKQLYVLTTSADWRTASQGVPVRDEQDALQKAQAARSICFTTYETSSVVVDGKTFTGAPENRSARRYIGIDKTYDRDGVFAEMTRIFGSVGGVRDAFMQHPADSVYITGLERPGEFIRLKDGEKVFDRKGQQLWPAPVISPETQHDISVMKPLHVKKQQGPRR